VIHLRIDPRSIDPVRSTQRSAIKAGRGWEITSRSNPSCPSRWLRIIERAGSSAVQRSTAQVNSFSPMDARALNVTHHRGITNRQPPPGSLDSLHSREAKRKQRIPCIEKGRTPDSPARDRAWRPAHVNRTFDACLQVRTAGAIEIDAEPSAVRLRAVEAAHNGHIRRNDLSHLRMPWPSRKARFPQHCPGLT
jgi:hypothetical protein